MIRHQWIVQEQRSPDSKSCINASALRFGYLTFAVITPAKNEAEYIERTIDSMLRQTVKPLKWLIVSDGSTDGTDRIVQRYLPKIKWMDLLRMPEHHVRSFAGKAHAFNTAYDHIKTLAFDLIGNVDADISFDAEYFAFLLTQFSSNPHLGVGGTPFQENFMQYNYRYTNIEHVSGACQLFRRECFDAIGGYQPLAGGGVDWVAVTTARMLGWQTRTFIEKVSIHHRKIGTAHGKLLSSRFRFGKQDYCLGGHPIWEIFRCLYQMKSKPYLIGGLALFFGYFWAFLRRVKRPIADELVAFHRKEQMLQLKKVIINIFQRDKSSA